MKKSNSQMRKMSVKDEREMKNDPDKMMEKQEKNPKVVKKTKSKKK